MNNKCEKCNEPTKYIYSLKNTADGVLYTFHCKNEYCPEGKILRDSIAQEVALMTKTRETNNLNGCDIEKLKIRKFIAGVSFYYLSDNTGIPVDLLSEYFNYRKPIPFEDYDKLLVVLKDLLY